MANTIKAYLYVAAIVILATVLALAVPVPNWQLTPGWPHADWVVFFHRHIYPWSIVIVTFLAFFVMGWISLRGAEHYVMRWAKAERFPNSKYPHISKLVEQLRHRFKLPYVPLMLIRTQMINAAAVGRRPSEAKILLTTGMLEDLTEEEQAAIIGHEMALIKNRQTLLNQVVAMWLGYVLAPSRWANKLPLEKIADDEGPGYNVVSTVLYWLATLPLGVLALHVPILRSRLVEADLDAAANCELYRPDERGNPKVYLDALRKAEETNMSREPRPRLCFELPPAVGHIFFVSPYSTRKGGIAIYHTHPPVKDRWQKVHDVSEDTLKRRLINVFDERVKDRTAAHIKEDDPPEEPANEETQPDDPHDESLPKPPGPLPKPAR